VARSRRAGVESVADHTLATAIVAWLAALDDPALDATRVLELAIVHDLVEAITGDPTPYRADEIPADPEERRAFFMVRHPRSAQDRAAKREAEAGAMRSLLSGVPDAQASRLRALWNEYEARETAEARFVKEADLLEAFLQSRRYAEIVPGVPVDGFRLQVQQEITHPLLRAIRDEHLDQPYPAGHDSRAVATRSDCTVRNHPSD
jgi:putative hydrolase of HD superfamily